MIKLDGYKEQKEIRCCLTCLFSKVKEGSEECICRFLHESDNETPFEVEVDLLGVCNDYITKNIEPTEIYVDI